MTQAHTDIPARGPGALSKPQLDVGFFTNRLEAMLTFWREEMGLVSEDPITFSEGLVQY